MSHKIFGLVGRGLSHSYSKEYITDYFRRNGIDAEYLNFDIEDVSEVRRILRVFPELRGFNVTMPYKEAIIPLLDAVSEEARFVSSVNTIAVEDGKLYGYNTDVPGFETSLLNFLGVLRPNKALILGSGGVSKAIQYTLRKLGIGFTIVSRSAGNGSITYEELTEEIVGGNNLIINATSLGMYPSADECPNIPYHAITNQHHCFDVIYNPMKTMFLSRAERNGAKICNGLEMLYRQADKALKIWRV